MRIILLIIFHIAFAFESYGLNRFDVGSELSCFPVDYEMYSKLPKETLSSHYVETNLLQIKNEVSYDRYLDVAYSTVGTVNFKGNRFMFFEAEAESSLKVYLSIVNDNLRYPKTLLIYESEGDSAVVNYHVDGDTLKIQNPIQYFEDTVTITETYNLSDNFRFVSRRPDPTFGYVSYNVDILQEVAFPSNYVEYNKLPKRYLSTDTEQSLLNDQILVGFIKQQFLQIGKELSARNADTTYSAVGITRFGDNRYLLFEVTDEGSSRVYLALLDKKLEYPPTLLIHDGSDGKVVTDFLKDGENLSILSDRGLSRVSESYNLKNKLNPLSTKTETQPYFGAAWQRSNLPVDEAEFRNMRKVSLAPDYVADSLLQISNKVERNQYMTLCYSTVGETFFEGGRYMMFDAQDIYHSQIYLCVFDDNCRYPLTLLVYRSIGGSSNVYFNIENDTITIKSIIPKGDVSYIIQEVHRLDKDFTLLSRSSQSKPITNDDDKYFLDEDCNRSQGE